MGRHYAIGVLIWHNSLNIAQMYNALTPLTIALFFLKARSESIGEGENSTKSDSGIGDAIGDAIDNRGHLSRTDIILSKSLEDWHLIFSHLLICNLSSFCFYTHYFCSCLFDQDDAYAETERLNGSKLWCWGFTEMYADRSVALRYWSNGLYRRWIPLLALQSVNPSRHILQFPQCILSWLSLSYVHGSILYFGILVSSGLYVLLMMLYLPVHLCLYLRHRFTSRPDVAS